MTRINVSFHPLCTEDHPLTQPQSLSFALDQSAAEGARVPHAPVFPCRRVLEGWIDAEIGRQIQVIERDAGGRLTLTPQGRAAHDALLAKGG